LPIAWPPRQAFLPYVMKCSALHVNAWLAHGVGRVSLAVSRRTLRFVKVRPAVLALVSLALVTAACSTSGTASTPNSTHPPPAAEVACGSGHLTVSALSGGGGAGNTYQVFGFRYSGPSTCSLSGYPELVALDDKGAKVVDAQDVPDPIGGTMSGGSTQLPSVTLHAGQTASAILVGTEIPIGQTNSCQQYAASFRVTPPGLKEPVEIGPGTRWGSKGFPICTTLRIGPVASGMTGGQPLGTLYSG